MGREPDACRCSLAARRVDAVSDVRPGRELLTVRDVRPMFLWITLPLFLPSLSNIEHTLESPASVESILCLSFAGPWA